jgi:hypothetical protein
MKDYIALVTVELHKFARQIPGGRPGTRRQRPLRRVRPIERNGLLSTVDRLNQPMTAAISCQDEHAILQLQEDAQQRLSTNNSQSSCVLDLTEVGSPRHVSTN